MKKRLGGLLILVALFVQNAAVLANDYPFPMPDSSYYEGFVYYDKYLGAEEGRLRGRIDFAVYDTVTYPNQFIGAGGYEEVGTGRYIYAYQIFNAPEGISNPVAYFAVLGIAEDIVDGIGAQEDPDNGVEPSGAYFDGDESRVVWEFTPIYISIGGDAEHSWFLVFSSDQPWVPGDYELKTPEEESPLPVPSPEPSTVALLGLGSALIFSRRRKFSK